MQLVIVTFSKDKKAFLLKEWDYDVEMRLPTLNVTGQDAIDMTARTFLRKTFGVRNAHIFDVKYFEGVDFANEGRNAKHVHKHIIYAITDLATSMIPEGYYWQATTVDYIVFEELEPEEFYYYMSAKKAMSMVDKMKET